MQITMEITEQEALAFVGEPTGAVSGTLTGDLALAEAAREKVEAAIALALEAPEEAK